MPSLGGPPVWWDADGDGVFPEFPNTVTATNPIGGPAELARFADPRWNRAVSRTGTQTLDPAHTDFRALFSPDHLLLSWEMTVDPVIDAVDAVWLGIQQVNPLPHVMMKVTLTDAVPNPAKPTGYSVQFFDFDALTLLPTPSWVGNTARVWVQSPFVDRWALQIAIPRSPASPGSGLNIPNEFKLWYTVFVSTLGGGNAQFHSGPAIADITQTGGNLPTTDKWSPFSLGIPTAGTTACAADVSLARIDVGADPAPESEIRFDPVTVDPNTLGNSFFARPTNVSSNLIGAGDISAQFFIANWGSQATLDITELWTEISPTGSPPTNSGDILAGATATAANGIGFVDTLDMPGGGVSERCEYLPDPRPQQCQGGTRRKKHQCMWVELSSTAGLTFMNKSVFRNMDFESASTLVREAEVSIVGLDPIPDGRSDRDVYLYVETRNMPESLDDDVRRDPAGPIELRAREANRLVSLPPELEELDPLRRRAEARIDSAMPTYRVHVYHATGESLEIDGTLSPVLHAQTSFGYWVGHDGELLGWAHRLEGVQLDTIAENFYKISVPNNGSATITTVIEAIEPKRFGLSFHGGVSIPHGSFDSTHDAGYGLTVDLEYRFTRRISAELIFAYHDFPADPAGTASDLDLFHVGANAKAYLTLQGPVRPFLFAGGGLYALDPGATDAGVNGGGGLQFVVSPTFALEATYGFNTVFTSGSNTNFSAIQAGARVRF